MPWCRFVVPYRYHPLGMLACDPIMLEIPQFRKVAGFRIIVAATCPETPHLGPRSRPPVVQASSLLPNTVRNWLASSAADLFKISGLLESGHPLLPVSVIKWAVEQTKSFGTRDYFSSCLKASIEIRLDDVNLLRSRGLKMP